MTVPSPPLRIASLCGLAASFNANGSLRELRHGDDLCVHLFPGNPLEAGSTQLVLRAWPGAAAEGVPAVVPLLGPGSPAHWCIEPGANRFVAVGLWDDFDFRLTLTLASEAPVWFWHLALHHRGGEPRRVDLLVQHDLGLASHAALRLNEYYVSHYLDFTPLAHATRGTLLAVRQNQPVAGRHPWAMLGSLRRAVSCATDALQVLGRAESRFGEAPPGWQRGLPGRRLQQEQALAALQDAPLVLAPGEKAVLGFFGGLVPDHPAASGAADTAWADAWLALPEAAPPAFDEAGDRALAWQPPRPSLFSHAPLLSARALEPAELDALFGVERRHEERGPAHEPWSFFTAAGEHVVLPAKERTVLRPHGHLLRSGAHLVPDEAALTSTCWMGGVFHSMVTQGHVSLNRLCSTVHGTLGQFRSQGLRVFVEIAGSWHLLDQPSAFAMGVRGARWWDRHAGGLLELQAEADADRPELRLHLRTIEGPELPALVTLHLALNGDDGEVPGRIDALPRADGSLWLAPPHGSPMHQRFPQGGFVVAPLGAGPGFARVSGAEALFDDGQDHGVPMLCLHLAHASSWGLALRGELITAEPTPAPHLPALQPPRLDAPGGAAAALATALPWFQRDALVHYLAPRGLEQYSGGGWGTRDVCQGPVELLLAQGCLPPVRDLLCRVFSAQDTGGDWPQWFMFFERDRQVRAGDSHGDIVFWPLLALGQYLQASGDAGLLETPLPFFAPDGAAPEVAPLWQHAERAMGVIAGRRIAGTALAAYGHGDWNDSLQPADPRLREHLCSAWTVTLHAQVLDTLAGALDLVGRAALAAPLRTEAAAVRADFHRWLMPGGVVTGYALFGGPPAAAPEPLLHPADARTGLRYSLLPMVHGVLSNLFTPEEAEAHLALVEQQLLGPDGARLFDAPLPYRGGPQTLFQRAESASYFGREIGLMYTHAHLRYAEALAHAGHAEAFWRALNLAHPVDLRQRVPAAAPRQANCYYSSSDAAFADRYEAQAHYADAIAGRVPLEGGWRVYSSGAGIALGLVQRCLLGLRPRVDACVIDPVLPAALDGLRAQTTLAGRSVALHYRVGGAGHGVRRVALNGRDLPFADEPHHYRRGGARIGWNTLSAFWAPAGAPDVIEVDTA